MTEDEFKKLIEDRNRYYDRKNRTARKVAHVEPAPCHGNMAEEKNKRSHQAYRLHIHHRTNKLTDPDGRSVKAAIDGLVEAGILPDDSPKFIKEVTQSQELVKGEEETIIDIIPI